MRLRIAFAVLLLSAPSAFAVEAVTYKGTIGKIPIILEMAEGTDSGSFAARYAYLSKGVDIPLHGKHDLDDGMTIEEEAPCNEKICKNAEGDILEQPPIGADWTLTGDTDGQHLKGTWKDRKSGKSLPISLTLAGRRSLGESNGENVDDLDPSSATVARDETRVTPKDLPYDFIKFDHPVKQGPETVFDGVTIRMDTDPFTATTYPTIVKLPGADTTEINTYLRQQWLQFQFNPYYCKSKLYLGYGWFGNESDGSNGFWDGANVSVDYLSTRLLGISESGSFYCGGAYPNHFINRRFADVKTGQPVTAERLLKGFIPQDYGGNSIDPATVADKTDIKYGPNADLVKFVNDRRDKSDASVEADCMMSDLVRTNLGVYFTKDELVFNLKDLPHVIFACTDDVVRIPLNDARPLLNDEGIRLLFGT